MLPVPARAPSGPLPALRRRHHVLAAARHRQRRRRDTSRRQPGAGRAKLAALIDDADVTDRLASAIGLSTGAFAMHEINWAARKFLEKLAADRPLVALIDDIHWAEPAFLDLLDHVLDSAEDAPILLLATSRPDLLEKRPKWGERPGSLRLELKPLSDAAAARVAENLLGASFPADVAARIVAAAEGNPLYVEQILAMLVDSKAIEKGDDGSWVRGEQYGEIEIPPTIKALLEARLGQLGRNERYAIEPASVIGLQFACRRSRRSSPRARGPGSTSRSPRSRASNSSRPSLRTRPSSSTASTTTWCATRSMPGS